MSNIVNLSTPSPVQQFYGNGGGGNGTTVPAAMFNSVAAAASAPPSESDGGADGAKRRRIARACDMCRKKKVCHNSAQVLNLSLDTPILTDHIDQMRWETTSVYALCELQDGMCVHLGREEEESS